MPDSLAGWVAYVREKLLFVKFYPVSPGGNYAVGDRTFSTQSHRATRARRKLRLSGALAIDPAVQASQRRSGCEEASEAGPGESLWRLRIEARVNVVELETCNLETRPR